MQPSNLRPKNSEVDILSDRTSPWRARLHNVSKKSRELAKHLLKRNARQSYAQCGEDLILDFLFLALGVKNGTYLDIGAHHPTKFSNTHRLYLDGWSGFNVDPLKDNIQLFDALRSRDVNIRAGVGGHTGRREFYRMVPDTLSTFDSAVAHRYREAGHAIRDIESVDCMTLDDLARMYKIPSDLDLLSIDVEGHEMEVLRRLGSSGLRPKVIICETVEYNSDLRLTSKSRTLQDYLSQNGYFIYADTFLNTVLIQEHFWKQADLTPCAEH